METLIIDWWAWSLTAGVMAAYTLYVGVFASSVAWRTHDQLRQDWLSSISTHSGSEILAVQTLRNSVMTATMTASTAALGLMGALGMTVPALRTLADNGNNPTLTPALTGEITVMLLLVLTLVSTTLSIRYYHHAGFVCAMPVGSAMRSKWIDTGRRHLRSAGRLYSVGLRSLIWVTPFLAGLMLPLAGVVVALLVSISLLVADSSH